MMRKYPCAPMIFECIFTHNILIIWRKCRIVPIVPRRRRRRRRRWTFMVESLTTQFPTWRYSWSASAARSSTIHRPSRRTRLHRVETEGTDYWWKLSLDPDRYVDVGYVLSVHWKWAFYLFLYIDSSCFQIINTTLITLFVSAHEHHLLGAWCKIIAA